MKRNFNCINLGAQNEGNSTKNFNTPNASASKNDAAPGAANNATN